MPTLRVIKTGAVGIIKDLTPQELNEQAWTSGDNVRFTNLHVEKITGTTQVFGTLSATATPAITPHWNLSVQNGTALYWVYADCDLGRVFATDGTTHTDITQSSASYSATISDLWNGCVLGGVPILNPGGHGSPQQWNPGLGNTLTDLDNWPANTSCKVMRSFKQYLLALHIFDGSDENERLLRWSHPADPGSVPISWDYTDPNYDAGQYELSETDDALIDCLRLRDVNLIYKQDHVIMQQLTASGNIFAFRYIFDVGLLTAECVRNIDRARHLFVSKGDVYVTDGNTYDSVIAKRWRNFLFNEIDDTYYDRMYVAANYPKKEMWICFPENGMTYCNKALVWQYEDNVWSIRDIPQSTYARHGIVDEGGAATWDTLSGTWDDWTGIWNESTYNPTISKLLIGDITNQQFQVADSGNDFNGNVFTAYVEHDALPLGPTLQGKIAADYHRYYKAISLIRPDIDGTPGGIVKVQIGRRNSLKDSIAWSNAQDWTIGTTTQLEFDTEPAGIIMGVKFSSTTAIEWQLNGYEIDYELVGQNS